MVIHMKYNEISLNEKIFGNDFIVYDWKESDNKIIILLISTLYKQKKTGTNQIKLINIKNS